MNTIFKNMVDLPHMAFNRQRQVFRMYIMADVPVCSFLQCSCNTIGALWYYAGFTTEHPAYDFIDCLRSEKKVLIQLERQHLAHCG